MYEQETPGAQAPPVASEATATIGNHRPVTVEHLLRLCQAERSEASAAASSLSNIVYFSM
jgi:hypothetical protein